MTEFKPTQTLTTLDSISFTEGEATAVYMFLRKYGVLSDKLKMHRDENGKVFFMKKFPYPAINEKGEYDTLYGDVYISFGTLIESLIRLDRKRWNAFKAVEKDINGLYAPLEKKLQQLRGMK